MTIIKFLVYYILIVFRKFSDQYNFCLCVKCSSRIDLWKYTIDFNAVFSNSKSDSRGRFICTCILTFLHAWSLFKVSGMNINMKYRYITISMPYKHQIRLIYSRIKTELKPTRWTWNSEQCARDLNLFYFMYGWLWLAGSQLNLSISVRYNIYIWICRCDPTTNLINILLVRG